MSNNDQMQFKIGIIGPTGVGKTSLITSILKNAEGLLSGTPLRLKEHDLATERRLAQYRRDLEGSILAGEFNPGALTGTQERFTFELELDAGVDGAGIRISFLDYPGRWLDPEGRPENRENEWKECRAWIAHSTVLIIPVEATVLMEAYTNAHKRALPYILTTPDVAVLAREWAKKRMERKHEPALLLVCPVKCESYFDDNGGRKNRSEELFKVVSQVYREVFNGVREEAKHIEIIYSPVDTIGCVEVKESHWLEIMTNGRERLEFSADYKVRSPGQQNVVGADTVLVQLCRQLVTAANRLTEDEASLKQYEAMEAQVLAAQGFWGELMESGFWQSIRYWINGEFERREIRAEKLKGEALEADRRVQSLREVVQKLAGSPMGPRVRRL
jgi:hypothetical protein